MWWYHEYASWIELCSLQYKLLVIIMPCISWSVSQDNIQLLLILDSEQTKILCKIDFSPLRWRSKQFTFQLLEIRLGTSEGWI